MGGIGHNSRPTREELELAFRERTRAQRIKGDTPFDLKWQWEVWLSDLGPNAKLVAFAIRIFANADGSGSCPSLDTLEQLTGLSRRHIQDNLRLIEQRFVAKERGRGRAPNRYTLTIPGETLQELAQVIDIRSRAPIALQDTRSEARDALQVTFVAGHGMPCETVVGQMPFRSRAPGAPDITIDITKNKKGEPPREATVAKVASALAAGLAATITPAAASAPPEPTVQVMQAPAECWQTPKAKMDAGLNSYERRAQEQIWMTPFGVLEVAGEFKAELEREFNLVPLKEGLNIAAARVRINDGALMAMREVRKAFSYRQSDLARTAATRGASYGNAPKPAVSADDMRAKYQKFYDGVE